MKNLFILFILILIGMVIRSDSEIHSVTTKDVVINFQAKNKTLELELINCSENDIFFDTTFSEDPLSSYKDLNGKEERVNLYHSSLENYNGIEKPFVLKKKSKITLKKPLRIDISKKVIVSIEYGRLGYPFKKYSDIASDSVYNILGWELVTLTNFNFPTLCLDNK